MFSKALFKQSCKANGIMWGIITFAVCFMLACVMLISGSGNIANLKNGLSDSIVESSIDSNMKDRGLNYYLMDQKALAQFDAYMVEETLAGNDSATSYANAMQKMQAYVGQVITAQGYEIDSVEGQEIQGAIFYVLNPLTQTGEGQFDSFYTALGEDAPRYDLTTIGASNRSDYIAEYAQTNASIFLAGNMIGQSNIDNILAKLKSFNVDMEKYQSFSYEVVEGEETKQVSRYTGTTGYKYIKNLSNTSILTFQTRLAYEISQGVDAETAITNIVGDLTKTLLTTLPADVANSLKELGEMDLYSMIVGSIFYKMAGLLLPIIYMIMAANNLIAGQVDRGSMAYVLSTSTKRRTVVFTQALYLIGSLFAMFCCTTVTSVICLSVLDKTSIALTYGELILLNFGAFMTMFAMSGISFLASCWFNRSKYSMSIGGGLNMFFLVATMLGLFGSKVLPSVVRLESLNFFNYVSIISLFDVVSIIDGGTTFIWKLAILLAVGVICYVIGGRKFEKKDLPL